MLSTSDRTYMASFSGPRIASPGRVSEWKPLPARRTRRPPATRRPLVVLLLDLDVLSFLAERPMSGAETGRTRMGQGRGCCSGDPRAQGSARCEVILGLCPLFKNKNSVTSPRATKGQAPSHR